ncbi:hypothetical protein P9112_008311 [Eukaryota sp. TZLM1-RC]
MFSQFQKGDFSKDKDELTILLFENVKIKISSESDAFIHTLINYSNYTPNASRTIYKNLSKAGLRLSQPLLQKVLQFRNCQILNVCLENIPFQTSTDIDQMFSLVLNMFCTSSDETNVKSYYGTIHRFLNKVSETRQKLSHTSFDYLTIRMGSNPNNGIALIETLPLQIWTENCGFLLVMKSLIQLVLNSKANHLRNRFVKTAKIVFENAKNASLRPNSEVMTEYVRLASITNSPELIQFCVDNFDLRSCTGWYVDGLSPTIAILEAFVVNGSIPSCLKRDIVMVLTDYEAQGLFNTSEFEELTDRLFSQRVSSAGRLNVII